MKDTLTNAALKLRVDQLQYQIDSLKNIKNPILEERLAQASDTVSNLGSLATGFGTVYTTLTILIAIVTIGVPIWLSWNAKKIIRKAKIKLDSKLEAFQVSSKEEVGKLENIFNEKIKRIEEQYENDLDGLETELKIKINFLFEQNIKALSSIEASDIFHKATNLMNTNKYDDAAVMYLNAFWLINGSDPEKALLALHSAKKILTIYSKQIYVDKIIMASDIKMDLSNFIIYLQNENSEFYKEIIEYFKNLLN
jgi:hypothetical protein